MTTRRVLRSMVGMSLAAAAMLAIASPADADPRVVIDDRARLFQHKSERLAIELQVTWSCEPGSTYDGFVSIEVRQGNGDSPTVAYDTDFLSCSGDTQTREFLLTSSDPERAFRAGPAVAEVVFDWSSLGGTGGLLETSAEIFIHRAG